MYKSAKIILSAAAVVAAGTCTVKAKSDCPNVVLILIDDMGQRDLSCYGSEFYQTPNIDQLAEEGVKFENGYAACTVSSPSRAAIMTGKYPARLRLTDWIAGWNYPYAKLNIPDWCQYLPLEEQTIAEQLKEVGYQTWHVGKWHLGDDEKYWPENQGFDINIGGWAKGSPYKSKDLGYNGYFIPYGNPRLEDGPEGEYLTDRLTDESVKLIEERDHDKPFFLNLCHYAVHGPLDAKADMIEKYEGLVDKDYFQQNTTFAAMVESVDESVKRVIDLLKAEGIYDNTLIIFTGDNGSVYKTSPALPLRLGKGERYEGGVRVPFIIKYGDRYSATTSEQPVITMDITATIQDVAGVKESCPDGKSILSLLKKEDYQRPLYWHYPHYHASGATPYSAIRVGDWKLIEEFEQDELQLYNLKEDVGETKNVAATEPKLRDDLYKMLQRWRDKLDVQYPSQNPNWDKERERKK